MINKADFCCSFDQNLGKLSNDNSAAKLRLVHARLHECFIHLDWRVKRKLDVVGEKLEQRLKYAANIQLAVAQLPHISLKK